MLRSFARLRIGPLGLLLACALVLRILVPAGWMPAHGHGLAIQICADGSADAPDPAFAAAAQQRFEEAVGSALAGRHNPQGGHDGKSQPCVFSALALAWMGTDVGELAPPPPIIRAADTDTALSIAVGRGLAAPPPPSTGPPARA